MAAIRGMEIFKHHFRDFQEQYVLIGGVASSLSADELAVEFRATKDFDIVLIIEALNTQFVSHFWDFVHAGGYKIRQVGEAGHEKPIFYRFQNPEDESYPQQLELFSRTPEGLNHPQSATLTPIPTDESVSSLSAILLDEAYYEFLLEGRKVGNDISYIGADRLIPFKARAWLDLSARKEAGDSVDSKSIRKHRNDVIVLSGLLDGSAVSLSAAIALDMEAFLQKLAAESLDLKSLGVRQPLAAIIQRLESIYLPGQQ